MIFTMVERNFGPLLRSRRLATIDPTTGRPFTQARLGELLDVSTSKVAAWEREDISSLGPEDVNLLVRVLPITANEILEALGYSLEREVLTLKERELLSAYRRLRDTPQLQEAALKIVRALMITPAIDYRPRRKRLAQIAE